MKDFGGNWRENVEIECSGRKLYAHGGVLKLSPEADGNLTYGWDSSLRIESALSQEERNEIAERMKAEWEKWRTLTPVFEEW